MNGKEFGETMEQMTATILEYFLEASLRVRPSKISGPASFRK